MLTVSTGSHGAFYEYRESWCLLRVQGVVVLTVSTGSRGAYCEYRESWCFL